MTFNSILPFYNLCCKRYRGKEGDKERHRQLIEIERNKEIADTYCFNDVTTRWVFKVFLNLYQKIIFTS